MKTVTLRSPMNMRNRKTTPKHMIIKLYKASNKEEILKAAKERDIIHRRIKIKMTNFSQEQCNPDQSLNYWKGEKTINLELYTQRKHLSKVEVK